MRLPDKESLTERFDQYTDDQLMDVLRNFKNFREEAVEVAVEIALERKLISSRQDLFSSEFNQAKVPLKKIFPLLNREQESKMLASLLRIVWLIAFVPVIFAVLSFAGGHVLHVILWSACALAWAAGTWRIERTGEARLVFLLALLFLCFHIIYFSLVRYTLNPGVMDLVVYLISVLVFFYLLSYLYVILRRRTKR